MWRRLAGVLMVLSVSGCQSIADCFCGPGLLSLEASPLGPVPRGCGRVDQLVLMNHQLRTFPELSIVSVTSTNPAVAIDFPRGVVGGPGRFGLNVLLTVNTEAALDAPASLETDVEVVTDTGEPRVISFHLSVPVIDATAMPPLDFGGIVVGTTASAPWSFRSLGSTDARRGFTTLTGAGFDYASLPAAADFELRFSPHALGPFEGSLAVDLFQHCPQLERMPLLGDGVTAILTATPATLDFGDVPVGTSVTRTIAIDSASPRELQLSSEDFGDFRAAFATTVLAPATRDAQGRLVPGRTLLEVTFTPTRAGPQSQTLTGVASSFTSPAPLRLEVQGVGN